jgi:hypothetical protein
VSTKRDGLWSRQEWKLLLCEGDAYGVELPHEWVRTPLQVELVNMNDQKMLPFCRIADYIEEHVLPRLAPEPKEET